MGERPVRGTVRGTEIVIATGYQNPQVRIASQRTGQIRARAGEAVTLLVTPVPVPVFVSLHRQNFVPVPHFDPEALTHVCVRRHGVGRDEGFYPRIELPGV